VQYNQSLEAKLNVLGKEHPSTADIRNNIAAVLMNKGDYDAALVQYD